jgi:hypothetical protein
MKGFPFHALVKQVCFEPTKENLLMLFEATCEHWKHPIRHNECFTEGAFDLLLRQVSCEAAFKLLEPAANLALAQQAETRASLACSLLQELARASATTEVPQGLRAAAQKFHLLPEFCQHSIEALRSWYRYDV